MGLRIKTLIHVLIISSLCLFSTSCDQASNPTSKRNANSDIPGKIVFKCNPWGICVYEGGKLHKWMPGADTGGAMWVGKDKIFFSRQIKERDFGYRRHLIDFFVADYRTKEEQKLFRPKETILIRGAFKDGNRFYGKAFEEGRAGEIENVVIYDKNTDSFKKVTNFQGDSVFLTVDLSPDETKFVVDYSSHKGDKYYDNMIIIDINGNVIKDFQEAGSSPKWSPDGRYIVYAKGYLKQEAGTPISDAEIVIYDIQRDEIKRLTDIDGIDTQPVFSPDGKKIAFVQWGGGGLSKNLAVMNADGSDVRMLLQGDIGDLAVHNPDWGE
jgi:Tol biopolymer transport system component